MKALLVEDFVVGDAHILREIVDDLVLLDHQWLGAGMVLSPQLPRASVQQD